VEKGPQVYCLRLPEDLMIIAREICTTRGTGKTGTRWTLNDFVRRATAILCRKMLDSRARAGGSVHFLARDEFLHSVADNELAKLQRHFPIDTPPVSDDPESGVDLSKEPPNGGCCS
jgi:hypothetical protein